MIPASKPACPASGATPKMNRLQKCAAFAALFSAWQAYELTRFNVTRYQISSGKVRSCHKWVVVSDLHSWQYGRDNRRLLSAIYKEEPEAAFFPGDLVVHSRPDLFPVVEKLLGGLCRHMQVFVSNGNHETRLEDASDENHAAYRRLKASLMEHGARFLNNRSEVFRFGGDEIAVAGLELPVEYYGRAFRRDSMPPMRRRDISGRVGAADPERFQVLLAHTPRYVPEYLDWGADLCLSGHYHGGLVCIPGVGSIISPQFELFPEYSSGRFDILGRTALVSRGMGTHTFHVRVFDRAELLAVELVPQNTTACGR